MKNRSFLYVLIVLSMWTCTDKSIDLDIVQDNCKRFKIKTPSYQLIEDPCNGSVKLRAVVQFEFNQFSECLNQLNNYPIFYQSDNSSFEALLYTAVVNREELIIQDNQVSYEFEVEFANQTEAQRLNHIILDFDTQDELGVKGNKLQIRINTSCSVLGPNSYTVNSNEIDIPVTQNFFTIRLWDNAAEDGDIVSVYLNGQWIIENHTLTKAGTDFTFSTSLLQSGANDLVVFALNEGSSGPNTVSIAVNGVEIKNFSPGLLTGEAVRINLL
tara:strand:+ start:71 stop:883 length:813 start_codon:yes stop_codon:yes gene_type:complete